MPGKLIFIGLGLSDEKDITLRGLEAIKESDVVFAERYTSTIAPDAIDKLGQSIGRKIRILSRVEVEGEKVILDEALEKKVAFLVAGDPMAATTHVSLRISALKLGIMTHLIHNASILSATAGALGLQHYKFGRTASLPFHSNGYKPDSPYETIVLNMRSGLHTLVLLDLVPDEGRYLTANDGIRSLIEIGSKKVESAFTGDTLVCVVCRLGSDLQLIRAGRASDLLNEDFGPPLHAFVIPGKLHFMEEEALRLLAGKPE